MYYLSIKQLSGIGFLLCFSYLFPIVGCKNDDKSKVEEEYVVNLPVDSLGSEPFYPYLDYLNSQLAYIKATPLSVDKKITINGKVISETFISRDELNKLAQPFLEINPEIKDLKPFYMENSFADLSIQKLTFSITATRSDLPLLQADILVNPNNEIVKNVVLKKQFSQGDSSVIQYLLWENKMYFQISETIQKMNSGSYTRVTKVTWDRTLQ
jgi:hypothetical protein